MALVDLKQVRLSFGGPLLPDGVDLVIEPGERLCLLGRNGEGKTSLLRIISGELAPDSGEITRKQGLQVGVLEQEVPGGAPGSVFDVVAGGIRGLGELVAEYHALSAQLAHVQNRALTDRLGEVQQHLERDGGWQLEQKIEEVISRLSLAPDAPFAALSAGLKRRSMLARALAGRPDLLLLDEPTNHLDIDAIGWLEEFLFRFDGSLLFVTHDRQFTKRTAPASPGRKHAVRKSGRSCRCCMPAGKRWKKSDRRAFEHENFLITFPGNSISLRFVLEYSLQVSSRAQPFSSQYVLPACG